MGPNGKPAASMGRGLGCYRAGGEERQAREFFCNRTFLVTVQYNRRRHSLECLRHWSAVLLDLGLHRIR